MSFGYICQDCMSHVLHPRINDGRALDAVSCKGKSNQACMYYCPLEPKNLKVCFRLRMSVLSSPRDLLRIGELAKC